MYLRCENSLVLDRHLNIIQPRPPARADRRVLAALHQILEQTVLAWRTIGSVRGLSPVTLAHRWQYGIRVNPLMARISVMLLPILQEDAHAAICILVRRSKIG